MQSIKQEALNAISSLPDNANIEEIMYRLYVIDKVKKGITSLDKGESLALDEFKKDVEKW